jgi:uncharacterized membrane protein
MIETDKPTYRLGRWLVREDWPLWLLFALCVGCGVALYPRLPERVPVHWDLHGNVNGWEGKLGGVFGTLGIGAAVYLLLVLLPLIDPRRANYAKFQPTMRVMRAAMTVLLLVLWGVSLAAAMGVAVKVDRIVPLAIAVLFIVLGNFLGRIRYNWFIGIRTPWSLSNEEAWRLTHRAAGPAFVLGGAVALVGAVMGGAWAAWAMVIGVGGASLFSVVYSYFAFQRTTRDS